jgi:mRNA interferase MazF
VKRGDIWTVAGGVYASKPRPAVIVQDDRFAATDSVTVAPITSMSVDAPLLRIRLAAGSDSGLRDESFVMVDKLSTVRRSQVHQHLGHVTAEQLVEIERSLIVFLGLAG